MIDEVKIYVRSGDGGDGLIHFRREKVVPRGGPAGGDGGHGGDVVLVVNPKMTTLVNFQQHMHFKARSGERGGANNRTGASASALVIEVPPGTLVRDAEAGTLLGDLVKAEDRLVVVNGGRGGRGNARFIRPRVSPKKGNPARSAGWFWNLS